MAEMNSNAPTGNNRAGVPRSKKLSTRIDLTPMVDLGFLLITFFIFTTTMSLPKAMKLNLPADTDDHPNLTGESTTLTVCPIAHNKVFYYHGSLTQAILNGSLGITDYTMEHGIGNIIREKQLALDKNGKGRKELTLIIKPGEESSYQNTVDILDEVVINGVKKYALTDISKEEEEQARKG